MSSSSHQGNCPNDTGATLSDTDAVDPMRRLLDTVIEFLQSTPKATRRDILHALEPCATEARYSLENDQTRLETAIRNYKKVHDHNHEIQAYKFAIEKSRPFLPLREYNDIQLELMSGSQVTARAMQTIRKTVGVLRRVIQVREWVVRQSWPAQLTRLLILSGRGTLQPEEPRARLAGGTLD